MIAVADQIPCESNTRWLRLVIVVLYAPLCSSGRCRMMILICLDADGLVPLKGMSMQHLPDAAGFGGILLSCAVTAAMHGK